MISSSHHPIVSSSHHFIISWSHHLMISPSHHLIIASSHHLIISSSHHLIISSSHHLIIPSSHHLIYRYKWSFFAYFWLYKDFQTPFFCRHGCSFHDLMISSSHHLIISWSHDLIIHNRSKCLTNIYHQCQECAITIEANAMHRYSDWFISRLKRYPKQKIILDAIHCANDVLSMEL